jgi:LPXTG-site transpeptidase (sortase) family protein
MKKKLSNIIIIVLIIALVIVLALIVIRYGKNYLNEKEVAETLSRIEQEFQKIEVLENNENKELLDVNYKGYKVEAILEIPKIQIKYPVINETNDEAMKVSITKFWGPEANEIGNYTVAGHNNKDGTMFGKTKYLQIGDTIKLTNLKNETVEYTVFKIYAVDPNDVSYVNSTESDAREITLITCTNGHKNRLITKARENKNI